MRFTLEDIFNIPSAVIYYPDRYKSASSVSIDTRTIKKNSIYVAIKGRNFDGHNFVRDAIKKGATSVIVQNRKLKLFDDIQVPIISVKNTIDAYAELARICRNKSKAKVISITGSNGKTSTKEMLAHLLTVKYKVHKTIANNNNNIGVPLTILNAPQKTDFIILEHGTNHFGEIEYTARIATPDMSLITNIGDSHLQNLVSREKVLEEKISLFNYTRESGIIFINKDDAFLSKLKFRNKEVVKFGFKGKVDIKAKLNKYDTSFITIQGLGKTLDCKIKLLGEANKKNFLAAVSIALKLGMSKRDIIKQAATLPQIKGRLELIELNDISIIDDTYNSNPNSVENAISVLKKFTGRKIKVLIFGDMFELGEESVEYHKQVGQIIDKSKFDYVFTIGNHSKFVFEKLKQTKNKKHFNRRSSLVNNLKKLKLKDAVFLVKGSRGMKMEDFVISLKENYK